MEPVSLIAAFPAGLLSFVSPCVLPLIPGYISFISGVTLEDMRTGNTRRRLDAGARR
jgi:cytochrome c-type biogenesis protein